MSTKQTIIEKVISYTFDIKQNPNKIEKDVCYPHQNYPFIYIKNIMVFKKIIPVPLIY